MPWNLDFISNEEQTLNTLRGNSLKIHPHVYVVTNDVGSIDKGTSISQYFKRNLYLQKKKKIMWAIINNEIKL